MKSNQALMRPDYDGSRPAMHPALYGRIGREKKHRKDIFWIVAWGLMACITIYCVGVAVTILVQTTP